MLNIKGLLVLYDTEFFCILIVSPSKRLPYFSPPVEGTLVDEEASSTGIFLEHKDEASRNVCIDPMDMTYHQKLLEQICLFFSNCLISGISQSSLSLQLAEER